MLDLSNLIIQESTQIFYANGMNWQVWNKPKKANYVYIYVIGSGAGGGRGSTGTASTRSGGGGGGSGAICVGLFQTSLLPDRLYLQVGVGGAGAPTLSATNTVGIIGSPGALSYVSITPDSTTPMNLLMVSGAAVPSNTVAGTVFNPSQAILSNLGVVSGIAGAAGSAPGASTTPAVNITLTLPISGGGGGSGCSSVNVAGAGASVNALSTLTPLIPAGTSFGNTTTGGDGGSGYSSTSFISSYSSHEPMIFTGGAGGGCSGQGFSGRGGDGEIGCGGGGSGAGQTGVGAGGKGGDGLILITCF